MKKVLLGVSAVPYIISFLAVTAIVFMVGKVPTRRDKTFLLPWFEFLCSVLTLLVGIGLLHLAGLRGLLSVLTACAAWLFFYLHRAPAEVSLSRATGALFIAACLYALSVS